MIALAYHGELLASMLLEQSYRILGDTDRYPRIRACINPSGVDTSFHTSDSLHRVHSDQDSLWPGHTYVWWPAHTETCRGCTMFTEMPYHIPAKHPWHKKFGSNGDGRCRCVFDNCSSSTTKVAVDSVGACH